MGGGTVWRGPIVEYGLVLFLEEDGDAKPVQLLLHQHVEPLPLLHPVFGLILLEPRQQPAHLGQGPHVRLRAAEAVLQVLRSWAERPHRMWALHR